MLLEVNNVRVSSKGESVLENISLHINKGEFIGLIGPNGAGKTTLLRTLLGLLTPTGGGVTRSRHTSIGYVPQNTAVYSGSVPMSVHEIVSLSGTGSTKGVRRALADARMLEYAKKSFHDLSGGQQQRVMIAKALATAPDVLILDEPTTGIDDDSKVEFLRVLGLLKSRGVTIVMVSHEIDMLVRLVSRIVYLNRVVLYDGPAAQFNAREYTSHV